jgi:hypothetical protein
MAYFRRTGATTFHPTEHVGGAWRTDEQHVAPTLGLLAHLVEADRDARGRGDLVLTRLSYDIWGTYPLDVMETRVQVARPGKGVELVEAEVACGGRTAITLRAWLARPGDTAELAAEPLPRIPAPDETPDVDLTKDWPGGFIHSVDVRRTQAEPGRATAWVRTDVPLIQDEKVSPTARAAGLLDLANGLTVRRDPREVAFPNLDLVAHLYRTPEGEWLGFDTTVTFGPTGLGLTSTVLHDERGPVGTVAQSLVVRRQQRPS